MYSLLFLGFTAFVLAITLTPLVRNLFNRLGLVDYADSDRKRHKRPLPKAGGATIAISFAGSFALLLVVGLKGAEPVEMWLPLAKRILPSAMIIFVTGLLDDVFGLRPWQKLVGQMLAALTVYLAGVQIGGLNGYQFPGWLVLPITIFWLILCTNAINLIDGVDGLAAGVGLFASATTLVAALLQKNFGLAAATMPLVGGLLGFLRYNFNPATVFLGDSGSLLVGFLLGCYGILWTDKAATILGMTAPLMALAIPLLDTGVAILRRFLRRKPIFGADREHIHHRLLDRGMTPRRVALTMYAVCSVVAVFSLLITSRHFEFLIIFLFCGASWIGIQHLGYVEFGVAGRMFLEGAFRRQLGAQIALERYAELLDSTDSLENCWKVIEQAAREFGFPSGRMVVAGRMFTFGGEPEAMSVWNVRVPLEAVGSLEFTRRLGDSWPSGIVAPFVEMVTRTIGPKLSVFALPVRKPLGRAAVIGVGAADIIRQ